jgi:hypothetical protein
MTTENDFFEELALTPELPPHLYGNIRRRIRRNGLLVRTALSLAATVVLTVGITGLLVSGNRNSATITPEVASELQSIKDFGNGADIPKNLETYAFYDGDVAN